MRVKLLTPSLYAPWWWVLPIARSQRTQVGTRGQVRSPFGSVAMWLGLRWESGPCFFLIQGDLQSQAMVRAVARQVCEQLIQSKWIIVTDVFYFSSKWEFAFPISVTTKEDTSKPLSWCRHKLYRWLSLTHLMRLLQMTLKFYIDGTEAKFLHVICPRTPCLPIDLTWLPRSNLLFLLHLSK